MSDPRVALVTGANRGIGLEVCRQLLQRNYTVILGAREQKKGEAAARGLEREGLRVLPRQLDIDDPTSVHAAIAWLAHEYGRLDALVNNAGINYDTHQTALTADLDEVASTFKINTLGAWRLVQMALPLLRKSGSGRVVNVSSEAGSLASMSAGTPAYSISKAALNAFTRMAAAEMRSSGILVNAVCPGWVATDMGGAGGRPVEEGAASVVWGVTLPDDGPTGGFFRDGKPIAW